MIGNAHFTLGKATDPPLTKVMVFEGGRMMTVPVGVFLPYKKPVLDGHPIFLASLATEIAKHHRSCALRHNGLACTCA